MTCKRCKEWNNRPLLCKLNFHKFNKNLCSHEANYKVCVRCNNDESWQDLPDML